MLTKTLTATLTGDHLGSTYVWDADNSPTCNVTFSDVTGTVTTPTLTTVITYLENCDVFIRLTITKTAPGGTPCESTLYFDITNGTIGSNLTYACNAGTEKTCGLTVNNVPIYDTLADCLNCTDCACNTNTPCNDAIIIATYNCTTNALVISSPNLSAWCTGQPILDISLFGNVLINGQTVPINIDTFNVVNKTCSDLPLTYILDPQLPNGAYVLDLDVTLEDCTINTTSVQVSCSTAVNPAVNINCCSAINFQDTQTNQQNRPPKVYSLDVGTAINTGLSVDFFTFTVADKLSIYGSDWNSITTTGTMLATTDFVGACLLCCNDCVPQGASGILYNGYLHRTYNTTMLLQYTDNNPKKCGVIGNPDVYQPLPADWSLPINSANPNAGAARLTLTPTYLAERVTNGEIVNNILYLVVYNNNCPAEKVTNGVVTCGCATKWQLKTSCSAACPCDTTDPAISINTPACNSGLNGAIDTIIPCASGYAMKYSYDNSTWYNGLPSYANLEPGVNTLYVKCASINTTIDCESTVVSYTYNKPTCTAGCPTVTVTSNSPVCEGAPIIITATINQNGAVCANPTFIWTTNAVAPIDITNIVNTSTTSTITIPVAAGKNAGEYFVTVVYSSNEPEPCGSCNITGSTVVNGFETPDAPTVAGTASICSGSTTTLTATCPNCSNCSVRWYSTPTGGTPIGSSPTFTTPIITANVTYYVECVKNNGLCASDRIAVPVTITSGTVATFTQLGPYCQNEVPGQLPTTSNNGITGTWNPASVTTNLVGTKTYTFTPTPGQCSAPVTMSIVTTANTALTVAATASCSSSTNSGTIIVNPINSLITYTISPPPPAPQSAVGTFWTGLINGNYTVTATRSGCYTPASVVVPVNCSTSCPTPVISPAVSRCSNITTPTILIVNPSTPTFYSATPPTYIWTATVGAGTPTVIPGETAATISVSPTVTTIYTCIVTYTHNTTGVTCTSIVFTTVTVNTAAVTIPNLTTTCNPETDTVNLTQATGTLNGAASSGTYSYAVGGTCVNGQISGGTTVLTPTSYLVPTGITNIAVQYTNTATGCKACATFTVTKVPCCTANAGTDKTLTGCKVTDLN